jgi:glycosyltransferase involved in cell wall biosynthesis
LKYSVIIPVYNTEKYLTRCLQSIVNQTFTDFEVIIVNDGSTDNSSNIISEYEDKYQFIKKIDKKNGGLSDSRNTGVTSATGDYIIFVDSDDYVAEDMLSTIDGITIRDNSPELIKFTHYEINGNDKREIKSGEYQNSVGQDLIVVFIKNKINYEPAWLYAYRRDFWAKNNFQYAYKRSHEDFGLTPIILLCAKTVSVVDVPLYYYIKRSDSITTTNDTDKITKNVYDVLYGFDEILTYIKVSESITDDNRKVICSHIANAVIEKIKVLPKGERRGYKRELKRRKVADLLLADSFMRKIKKIFIKIWQKF